MGQRIDGRLIQQVILAQLRPRIDRLPRKPGLGVVLVGDDRSSALYVRLKQRAAETIGVKVVLQRFPASVTQAALLKHLDDWNRNPELDAVLVQLPLPRPLDENAVIARLHPDKDADGFHPVNVARFLSGERPRAPVLVDVVLRLLEQTNEQLHGRKAMIVAKPSVFSQCLTHACAQRGLPAIVVPPDDLDHDAASLVDVIVVAAGRSKLITPEHVKRGAILIDIGINTGPDQAITGDVDPAAYGAASWYTPVPGGVGPVTIAVLLDHVVRIAERNQL